MAGSMGSFRRRFLQLIPILQGTGVFITGDVSATLAVIRKQNNSNLFGKTFESSLNNTNLGQVGGVSFETKQFMAICKFSI